MSSANVLLRTESRIYRNVNMSNHIQKVAVVTGAKGFWPRDR